MKRILKDILFEISSTSPSGGNLVDGLPPAASLGFVKADRQISKFDQPIELKLAGIKILERF